MTNEYNGAILITGPSNEDNHYKKYEILKEKFNTLFVIGDGKIDLIDDEGNGPLQALYTLKQDNQELLNKGKLLIYLNIHGISKEGEHYLGISENSVMTTKYFFKLLSEVINRPMDIIFEPCYGKVAIKYANILPSNSKIIFFSEENMITISPNLETAMNNIHAHEFSIDLFYSKYLSNLFSQDENPILYTVGKQTIDPIILSKSILGKSISEDSREFIHENFAKNICSNDSVCYEVIERQIDKIEQINSIDEFKIKAQDNYIKALTQYMSAKVEYSYKRNLNYEISAKYNIYHEESCYIELLEFKDKLDKLLFIHELSLEFNLDEERLQIIEINYDKEDIIEKLENLTNAGIYNLIKSDGFIENNNFPYPAYEEYGLTLGIIVDIYNSLNTEYSYSIASL